MAISFRGGILPDEAKYTAASPTELVSAGNRITLPVSGFDGEEKSLLVKEGDRVLVGQKIAQGESLPLFSGISGQVQKIGEVDTPRGKSLGVIIENDYKMTLSPEVQPFSSPLHEATEEELCDFIRQKGIFTMTGEAEPVWTKIQNARGKAERILINCCESEPYLTANHRLTLEKSREIVGGTKILLKALGAKKAIFATEKNKEDGAEALLKIVGKSPNFSVAVLKAKYPQEDEKLLCRALRGREIPQGGKSEDIGIAIFDVQTAYAVYRAFVEGMPPLSKYVTVSGEKVKTPSNLCIPFGVPLSEIFQRCGGFSSPPDVIVCGGPMTGFSPKSTEVPFTYEVNALLALRQAKVKKENCIRCGRCIKACPMHLLPYQLSSAAKKKKTAKLVRYGLASCTECGSCSYVCPSGIDLSAALKEGKALIKTDEK